MRTSLSSRNISEGKIPAVSRSKIGMRLRANKLCGVSLFGGETKGANIWLMFIILFCEVKKIFKNSLLNAIFFKWVVLNAKILFFLL